MPRAAEQLSDFEDFALAYAKYCELRQRQRDLTAEARAVTRQIGEMATAGSDDGELDARARAILEGNEGPVRRAGLESLRSKLGDLADEAQVVTRAVGLQKNALTEIRHRRSLEIAERFAGRHRKAAASLVAAFVSFEDALKAEAAVRAELAATGADPVLPDFQFYTDFGIADLVQRARAYAGSR
jgi:hypothetical protein